MSEVEWFTLESCISTAQPAAQPVLLTLQCSFCDTWWWSLLALNLKRKKNVFSSLALYSLAATARCGRASERHSSGKSHGGAERSRGTPPPTTQATILCTFFTHHTIQMTPDLLQQHEQHRDTRVQDRQLHSDSCKLQSLANNSCCKT